MGKIRVLRGAIEPWSAQGPLQLITDDFRFNHGYRVTKFVISYQDLHSSTAASRDGYGVLATHPGAIGDPTFPASVIYWGWQDRRQIAWASYFVSGDSSVEQTFMLVDPTHIIVRDLYIGITVNSASTADRFNYYIELEEVELTEDQAVLAIIQEEAQDVQSSQD